MKTSEVLDLAADQIQQRGWAVGTNAYGSPYFSNDPWGREGGRVCIEGALMAVLDLQDKHGELIQCAAYDAVVEYLAGSAINRCLYYWNDTPGRTSEEVIEVLRAAAAVERAKGEALVAVAS